MPTRHSSSSRAASRSNCVCATAPAPQRTSTSSSETRLWTSLTASSRRLTGEPYQGFSFRRKGQPLLLDNGAANMKFGVTYKGQPSTSVTVDIARAEAGEAEVEWVDAIALTDA